MCRAFIIFKDPLYWEHSTFSSGAQQTALPQQSAFLHTNALFNYHNLLQALFTYTLDLVYNIGSLPCILLAISVVVFYLRKEIAPEKIDVLIVLVPFPFYVFSLFTGQAVIYIPGSAPMHATLTLTYYNSRYGVQMAPAAAIFLATLATSSWKFFRINSHVVSSMLQWSLCILIAVQSILIATGGIVALQEGQYGFDCAPLDPVVLYMVEHYNGGRILSDTFTSQTRMLGPEAGIPFKNMIYEGSETMWTQALATPDLVVDWVIANPKDPHDFVAHSLNVESLVFLSHFTLEMQQGNGTELFHRKNAPTLPSHPVPGTTLIAHRQCINS